MSQPNESPKKSLWVLDRHEGPVAIMISDEYDIIVCLPPPPGVEGGVYEQTETGFVYLPKETEARRARIRAKKNQTFRKRD